MLKNKFSFYKNNHFILVFNMFHYVKKTVFNKIIIILCKIRYLTLYLQYINYYIYTTNYYNDGL